MKNKSGITLIELLVVIATMGTLAAALVFSFQGWLGNYHAESQTKEMYADLMNARGQGNAPKQTALHRGGAKPLPGL